jgi:large subunit ribosomal protein L21e
MLEHKRIRQRGKRSLSKYFHEYKTNDKVALIFNLSEKKGRFSKPFHGRTGSIVKKQGRAYIVKFLDGRVVKKVVTTASHLKPLK